MLLHVLSQEAAILKYYYEEVPRMLIDRDVRVKESRAVAFAMRDLNMHEIPLYYVRQLDWSGGGRLHYGKTFVIEFPSDTAYLHGVALLNKNTILIDKDKCREDDIMNTVLHEYRHFYHFGKLNSREAMEYDSDSYAADAELAMYGYASTSKELYKPQNTKGKVKHTQ